MSEFQLASAEMTAENKPEELLEGKIKNTVSSDN
ncbi:hypothetical protein Salpa_5723 [Sporomusa sp. KB1]|jgi:hypothetical protein|nr:hypothetical protein Salpa_5723 [Sporomusa sp. KB1]